MIKYVKDHPQKSTLYQGYRIVLLTASQVDQKGSFEVFVVDEHCVLPGATLVLEGKVT